MPFGYCGRILKVNLSNQEVSVEEPPENFYRRYFGGEALIAYYLIKELKPGVDPYNPDNLLIFATGVITGHPFSGSGRNSVGGKSPLTGGFGSSEGGGYWGTELKRTGYDAIVVTGSSDTPSYLWIKDGEVEFKDASSLWGKKTGEVDELLRKELNPNIRIAQIGPGGEKKIRYACVVNDLSHVAGRTGMGAVMGSKKLKALAVQGKKAPEMAEPEKVRDKARQVVENPDTELPIGQRIDFFKKHGTSGSVLGLNTSGGLPTTNFKDPSFEFAEDISGERMVETILTGTHTCFGCTLKCKRTVKIEEPYKVDPKYGGPEYETIASLGSNCGIKDLRAIAKANEICNSYGVDTISAGMCISFAMECFKEGLLNEKDTDGVSLKFGDSNAMLQTLTQIVERRSLGRILGEGVKRAAEEIGKGSEKFAFHVKGQEIPLHEPRLKKGLGIGYTISPTGADHCHNMHDTLYQGWNENMRQIQALGFLEPIPANMLSPEKIRLLVYGSNWRHFTNSAVICYFTPWYFAEMPSLVNAVTGWNTTTWELLKVGERAATLARVFNVREGFTAEDDLLPERFSQPFDSGPIAGEKVTQEEVERCKKVYYNMMGWAENGIPTREKLYELDVGWAADQLPK